VIRSRKTIVYFIVISAFLGIGITNTNADDDESWPILLLPSNLGEVRFGDPIYVPLAVANRSKFPARCPHLTSGSPAINCYFTAPNQKWEGIYNVGKYNGGAGVHLLPPRHAVSTVVCVDVWHPKTASILFDSRKVMLEFEEIGDDGEPNNGVSSRTTATIAGSAFKNDEWILTLADRSYDAWLRQKIRRLKTSQKNHYFGEPTTKWELREAEQMFQEYHTPVELGTFWWLEFADDKFDLNNSTSFGGFAYEEEWSYRYKSLLDENSALFRMVRSLEIIHQIKDAAREELPRLLREYRDNLRNAAHAEYNYLVQLLYRNLGSRYDSLDKKELIVREFLNELSSESIDTDYESILLPIPPSPSNKNSWR